MEVFLKFITLDDIFVFGCLAVIGAVGAFIKFIIVNYDFDKKAYEIEKPKFKSYDAGGAQVLARILLGSVAAMLMGLALADAIKPEREAFFKLLLLGFFAGYIAPEFFRSQERRMLKYLAQQLNKGASEKEQEKTGTDEENKSEQKNA